LQQQIDGGAGKKADWQGDEGKARPSVASGVNAINVSAETYQPRWNNTFGLHGIRG
jgi:hypothetical protein